MLPDKAVLFICAIEDEAYRRDKVRGNQGEYKRYSVVWLFDLVYVNMIHGNMYLHDNVYNIMHYILYTTCHIKYTRYIYI